MQIITVIQIIRCRRLTDIVVRKQGNQQPLSRALPDDPALDQRAQGRDRFAEDDGIGPNSRRARQVKLSGTSHVIHFVDPAYQENSFYTGSPKKLQ